LTLPTFAALLMVVTAVLHPNASAYLLFPLTFIAPGGFICAIIIAVGARHSMSHRLFRVAWIVLALAFLAGMAAIGFVKLT
jgi:hypothetical protein